MRDGSPLPTDQMAARRSHAALGPTLARLWDALSKGDVIAILADEVRAEAVARAAARLTDAKILRLPPPDSLPGEDTPSSPATAGKRVAALRALRARGGERTLLVTDAVAAAHLLAPPEAFEAPVPILRVGEKIDRETLAVELERAGYFPDERIDEPGEVAVRGNAIDIFPPDAERPVRALLDEERIVRLSRYDPVTQLADEEELAAVTLTPAVEPPPGGEPATIFDHFPAARVALDPEAPRRRDGFLRLAREAGGTKAEALLFAWEAGGDPLDLEAGDEQPGTRFVEARRPERAFLAALAEERKAGQRVVLAGSSRDLRFLSRRIEQRLGEAPRPVGRWSDIRAAEAGALLAAQVELERGWREPGLAVIAAADVLGSRALDAALPAAAPLLFEGATELRLGDAVIHEEHGLGILRGLEAVPAGETETDAIRLEYAGETKRLVPVEEAHRLWRYGAEADAVRLDRLDGSTWEKRRAELGKTIAATARQLVALAAARAERKAPALEPPVADYERFVSGFPFTETTDQLRAIEAVRADLASGRPMDRLVVGDVGYGKTEVALRAAAIAALAGRQVALVAPTTVLVRQHEETFRRRFAPLGIEVVHLSRLSSAKEAREAKKKIADGTARIAIGTQALAGKTVAFHDLGLVIVDEEQRFGAADKAKLRALGEGGHTLTLTATPIPRTLQAALVGLQDLSLIATPPARRLPIRTQLAGFTPELVKGALLREKRRGGQSFLVVPQIEDIEPMAERLTEIVPGLSIRRAHGKMPATEADEEMVRFADGDGDILLATNIIEAGLDIPRANTMLVWRAERFGLAQLHQLRGRVGRGRSRGYFYLLTEEGAEIGDITLKRLRTMEALDQLGAGFAISARDLDLRGAGELLGEEQAGHMKLIGVDLYQHLLERAIRTARGAGGDEWLPDLNLGIGARLPEAWIPEEELRINLYARIARLASPEAADGLVDELEDRFGAIPDDAQLLVKAAQLRLLARDAEVARIDAGPAAIAFTPRGKSLKGAAKAGLERKGDRFLLRGPTEPGPARLDRIAEVLEALGA
jgi:transcription-repair coupling factor (superfamily II helicase)